jgi:hypothetical protein
LQEKGAIIAMQAYDAVDLVDDYHYEANVPVSCPLFDDRVAKHVCTLVKKELYASGKQEDSCRGCARHWLR